MNESNETNNIVALPVNLNVDLALSNVSIGAVSANNGGSYTIPVTFTVTNQGTVAANPNWFDLAYLSADGVLDNTDQYLSSYNFRSTLLAPGASYTVTVDYNTSGTTAAGAYTLFVKTDGHSPTYTGGTATDNGNLNESNETNNIVALPVNF